MRTLLTAFILTAFVSSGAETHSSVQTKSHIDPGIATTWIEPLHVPPGQGPALKMRLRFEPYVGQKLDKKEKFFRLAITPIGGLADIDYPDGVSLLFVADGAETTIEQVRAVFKQGLFGPTPDYSWDAPVAAALVRNIAASKSVWATVLSRGGQRISVQLTDRQIGVFRDMVQVYDSMEPQAAAADIVHP
ncbi:MAG TPA: hypothetical protein VM554_16205 [Acidisarcina sp.]|nr:hypothetical protein [Acidisarcina sp.]